MNSVAGGADTVVTDVLWTSLHLPTLCTVVAVALLLCSPTAWGPLEIQPALLASSVLQVAGTMVALALPAAEMANSMISDAESKLAVLVDSEIADKVPLEVKLAASSRLTSELRDALTPAWRSAVYALLSLLIAAAAMLVDAMKAGTTFHGADSVASVLAIVSLLCLIAAALWVYPTVRYIFRLKFIDELASISKVVMQQLPTSSGTPMPEKKSQ